MTQASPIGKRKTIVRRSGAIADSRTLPLPPDCAPNLRERKKARLRVQIYERALQLFRQHGYGNTSVNDIIGELRISRRTFFRYFPRKDALLHEYQRHFYSYMNDAIRKEMSLSVSTVQCLTGLYDTLACEIERDRRLWQAIVSAGLANPWRSPETRALDRPTINLTEAIVAMGQKRGDLQRAFPASLLVEFLEGICVSIYSNWASAPDNSYPLTERLRSALAFFMAGANAPSVVSWRSRPAARTTTAPKK